MNANILSEINACSDLHTNDARIYIISVFGYNKMNDDANFMNLQ